MKKIKENKKMCRICKIRVLFSYWSHVNSSVVCFCANTGAAGMRI